MRRLTIALVLSFGAALGLAAPASARDTACTGVLTGRHDNVVVPRGAACELVGADVRGNVRAQPDSSLIIDQGTVVRGNVEVKEDANTGAFDATIRGNYTCDRCIFEDVIQSVIGGNVQIAGSQDGDFILSSSIGGNIHIKDSTAVETAFLVEDTDVGGDVIFEKNAGDASISGNRLDGDLKVLGNRGEIAVLDNVIDGSLECFGNQPPPASAGNAAEDYEGQCQA
jgi:hypothetical protein